MQYRRASLVVLAALEDLDTASKAKSMVFPRYMRDKSMSIFPPEHRARQISLLVTNSYWYRWLSMGVIAISIIAVVWTPNSSDTGPDSKASFEYLTPVLIPFVKWHRKFICKFCNCSDHCMLAMQLVELLSCTRVYVY